MGEIHKNPDQATQEKTFNMNLLKLYKANMINEAEKKARYFEAKATTATDQETANVYYRKARIQLIKLKGLLSHQSH